MTSDRRPRTLALKVVRPIASLLVVAALVFVWSNPWGGRTVIYCPVREKVDGWPFSERNIVRHDQHDANAREFVVDDGELYLAVQETHPSLFMTTFVHMHRWDWPMIRAFRDRHPELEAMWPTPSQDHGGVQWAKPRED